MQAIVKGFEVFFDEEDAWLFNSRKWRVNKTKHNNYLVSYRPTKDGKKSMYYFHIMVTQNEDQSLVVDHKNGNGLDNRRDNLRVVERSVNSLNRKIGKGYTFDAHRKKPYRVVVGFKKQYYFVGSFLTEQEAVLAKAIFINKKFPGVKLQ